MNSKKTILLVALLWLACSLAWALPSAESTEAHLWQKALRVNIQRMLGAPYVWGGTRFKGADCSGALWRILKESGYHFPRTTARKMWVVLEGKDIPGWRDGAFGDLVWWTFKPSRPFGHIGIIWDEETNVFAHASSATGFFTLSRLRKGNTFDRNFAGARRLNSPN